MTSRFNCTGEELERIAPQNGPTSNEPDKVEKLHSGKAYFDVK
jgi:hypothetical protein